MKKRTDGSSALSCTRSDGTVAWQVSRGATAQFFPLHDLTHYAVETVMEYREGFYGLLAAGWEFSDFGSPWPHGPIPAEAAVSELIVGLLDTARASGKVWSAEELASVTTQYFAENPAARGLAVPSDAQLSQIRADLGELFIRWNELTVGDQMTLEFCNGEDEA